MKEIIEITIKEGPHYFGFYSGSKWIRGGKKCYLWDLMVEIADYYHDICGVKVLFLLGGEDSDEQIRRQIVYYGYND